MLHLPQWRAGVSMHCSRYRSHPPFAPGAGERRAATCAPFSWVGGDGGVTSDVIHSVSRRASMAAFCVEGMQPINSLTASTMPANALASPLSRHQAALHLLARAARPAGATSSKRLGGAPPPMIRTRPRSRTASGDGHGANVTTA